VQQTRWHTLAAAWRSLLATAALVGIVNSSSATEHADLSELRSKALKLVNEAREQHGLPALQSRPELDRAAQAHAEDMLNQPQLFRSRLAGRENGVRPLRRGGRESLATGRREYRQTCKGPPRIADVTRLQDGWMRSASHRENS
jgi:uncharacterized protein YkwD